MIPCAYMKCIHNKDACCILNAASKITNSTLSEIKCLHYEERKPKKETKLPSSL